MTSPLPSRLMALPVLLAAVVGFAFQGSRSLYETTEGRYAECAREMIQTGDWLVPQLGYEPHLTKPPLTYWAIAGGMELLGRNEWGVRFYGALAFLLSTWVITELALAIWGPLTAFVAGLAWATTPFVIVGANIVSTDILLTLWAALMLLAYWRARRCDEGLMRRAWIVLMWLAVGLGFLTKGPVILIFLAPFLIFNVWMRRRGESMPRLASWIGLLVFAVVGLGWFLWIVLSREGMLSYFLGVEVYGRVFREDFERNPEWYKPFVMYLPTLAFGTAPWAFFVPWIIARVKRLARPRGFCRHLLQSEWGPFFLLSVLLPLIVFFVTRSRMFLYVLPLMIPIVLSIARGLVLLVESRRRLLVVCVVSGLAVTGAGVLIKAYTAHRSSGKDLHPLYEAVRDVGRPDMPVLLCNEREFYSLQFYLDGRMRHVTTWSGKESTGTSLTTFLQGLAEKKNSPPCLLLARKDPQDVKDALREAGWAWHEAGTACDFTFYIIKPHSVPSAFAAQPQQPVEEHVIPSDPERREGESRDLAVVVASFGQTGARTRRDSSPPTLRP